MTPVGVSTARFASHPARTGATSEVASPIPPNFRTTLTKVNDARFVAQGHAGGRFEANVYVTPTAKEAAFAFAGKVELGTVLVLEELERGREDAGPLLMMEKMPAGFAEGHGDWRYTVVDGNAVTTGPIDSCTGCHDEAPHDHVFRIGD
jgi:hypothetical protein